MLTTVFQECVAHFQIIDFICGMNLPRAVLSDQFLCFSGTFTSHSPSFSQRKLHTPTGIFLVAAEHTQPFKTLCLHLLQALHEFTHSLIANILSLGLFLASAPFSPGGTVPF